MFIREWGEVLCLIKEKERRKESKKERERERKEEEREKKTSVYNTQIGDGKNVLFSP